MKTLSAPYALASSLLLLLSAIHQQPVHGFTPGGLKTAFRPRVAPATRIQSAAAILDDTTTVNYEVEFTETEPEQHHDDGSSSIALAPLKYIGPYPCLALRFPHLSTSAMKERNATGVSLDFVLDTAANTNTINRQVAQELGLEIVGKALPGLGAQGAIEGGDTYLLGDAQLEGVQLDENDKDALFMTDLTTAALPVANPATAGLLSLAFLQTFPGGVEFSWGEVHETNGTIKTPPSVSFRADPEEDALLKDMVRVPIRSLPITDLPSVTVQINGMKMPALLDTGSPITVLNAQAAEIAGVKTIAPAAEHKSNKNNNPFAAVANKFKEAQEAAKAAARGDVLAIMNEKGERVELRKTLDKVHVALQGDNDQVDFGKGNIYVGDVPGLAAMNGLGVEAPPAMVLGMDVLRTKPKMLLRAQQKEVYF